MIDRAAQAPTASPPPACGAAPQGAPRLDPPLARPGTDAAGLAALARSIRAWGAELGFDAVSIAEVDLSRAEAGLMAWLAQGYHGDMDYMANHGVRRARPAELV
ncbi:tRNA epoxyqueuosine(34) reductase QueG, partial [Cupriavidus basilensis]|nr:tRNA epoxyqueuosine(34) reductase QueG [Cupriavidus basilensis]